MRTVSVILDTYNRAYMLPRAVESVFAQDHDDWELIICDDGSDDGTRDLVEGYLRDPRVRYIRQPVRTGTAAAGFNDAIDAATGRYVCFLDDDNAMAPTKLSRMCARLDERPDVGMFYCRSRRMDVKGGLHEPLPMNKPPRFDAGLLRDVNYIDTNEVMIRREVFDSAGYFDERARRFEDWELWNRIALVSHIEFMDEPLSWYCIHPGQRVHEPGNDEENAVTRHLFNGKLAHGYPRWRVLIVWPTREVTYTQQDCMAAIAADLGDQSWIEPRYTTQAGRIARKIADTERPALIVLWMLFRHPLETLDALRTCGVPVVGICIEDPYAVFENMARVPAMSAVFTNDAATAEVYRQSGQARIAVMPTLGVCESWDMADEDGTAPTHDAVTIGQAYPERVIVLRNLALRAPDLTFLAIGDSWNGLSLPPNVTTERDVPRKDLVAAYRRGRTILALNRKQGAPMRLSPRTPARGFIEAMAGRPVIHDGERCDIASYFVNDREALTASNLDEMLAHIRDLVAEGNQSRARELAAAGRERARSYTYPRRWRRMVHMLMAGRLRDIP